MCAFLEETVFGRPFVKQFALCYWTIVCVFVCLSCNVGVLRPNGGMDQDATWYAGRPRPGPSHIVLDGVPAPPRKGAQQPPTFQSMSIMAKRSHISATAELVFA